MTVIMRDFSLADSTLQVRDECPGTALSVRTICLTLNSDVLKDGGPCRCSTVCVDVDDRKLMTRALYITYIQQE